MQERQLIKDVSSGNLSGVKEALSVKGLSADTKYPPFEHTILHLACWEGHEDIVEFLLQQGASVDGLNSNSATPLHGYIMDSVMRPKLLAHGKKLISLLLHYGANPTVPCNRDSFITITPIISAVGKDTYPILREALLEIYKFRISILKTAVMKAIKGLKEFKDDSVDPSLEARLWFYSLSEIFQAFLVRLRELQCLCEILLKEPHRQDLLSNIWSAFEKNQIHTQRYYKSLLKEIKTEALREVPSLESWVTATFQELESLWSMSYEKMKKLPWVHQCHEVSSLVSFHEGASFPNTPIFENSFSSSEDSLSSSLDVPIPDIGVIVPTTIVTLSPYHSPAIPTPPSGEGKPVVGSSGRGSWFTSLTPLFFQASFQVSQFFSEEGLPSLQRALQEDLSIAILLLQQGADVHSYVNNNPQQEHLTTYYLHGGEFRILRLLGLYGGALHECFVLRSYKHIPSVFAYPSFVGEKTLVFARASYQLRQALQRTIEEKLNFMNSPGPASSTPPSMEESSSKVAWELLKCYSEMGHLWWLETQVPPSSSKSELEKSIDVVCRHHYAEQAISCYEKALSYLEKVGEYQYQVKNFRNVLFKVYARLAELTAQQDTELQKLAKKAAYFSQSWEELYEVAKTYFKKLEEKSDASMSTPFLKRQAKEQLKSLREAFQGLQCSQGENSWEVAERKIDIIEACLTLGRVLHESSEKTKVIHQAFEDLEKLTQSLGARKNFPVSSETKVPFQCYQRLLRTWISCYMAQSPMEEGDSMKYLQACLIVGKAAEEDYKRMRWAAQEEGASFLELLRALYETLQRGYCILSNNPLPNLSVFHGAQLRHRASSTAFFPESIQETLEESRPLLGPSSLPSSSHPLSREEVLQDYEKLLSNYDLHIRAPREEQSLAL